MLIQCRANQEHRIFDQIETFLAESDDTLNRGFIHLSFVIEVSQKSLVKILQYAEPEHHKIFVDIFSKAQPKREIPRLGGRVKEQDNERTDKNQMADCRGRVRQL